MNSTYVAYGRSTEDLQKTVLHGLCVACLHLIKVKPRKMKSIKKCRKLWSLDGSATLSA